MQKKYDRFVKGIVKLEPQEFIGVCKILGIKLGDILDGALEWNEDKTIKLIDECLQKFQAAPPKRQKELIKIIQEASKYESGC